MIISDDELPEPPLIVKSGFVEIVEGEVVLDVGLEMIVMSPEAAIILADRILEKVERPKAG